MTKAKNENALVNLCGTEYNTGESRDVLLSLRCPVTVLTGR